MSVTERKQVARKSDSPSTARSLNWYDMTLLGSQEQDPRSMAGCDRFSAQVARQTPVSEGATTNTKMGLETDSGGGGSSKIISLAKREC